MKAKLEAIRKLTLELEKSIDEGTAITEEGLSHKMLKECTVDVLTDHLFLKNDDSGWIDKLLESIGEENASNLCLCLLHVLTVKGFIKMETLRFNYDIQEEIQVPLQYSYLDENYRLQFLIAGDTINMSIPDEKDRIPVEEG